MCVDVPGEAKQPRIAVCACGAYFPECDLREAKVHITTQSSVAHRWVWVREDYVKEIPRSG
jgi:hypothetical protein